VTTPESPELPGPPPEVPPGTEPPEVEPPGVEPPGVEPPGVEPPGVEPPGTLPSGDSPNESPADVPQSGSEAMIGELTEPLGEKPTPEEVLSILKDAGVPTISIGGLQIPLSAGSTNLPVWALVNLILAIAGIALAVFAVLRKRLRSREEDDEDYDEDVLYADAETTEETDDEQPRKKPVWLILSVLLGLAGIILFLITEDMRNLMVLLDRWTIVNAIIFAAEIIAVRLVFKRKEDEKDEEEETAETA
jgi:hypothetical protein